MSYKILTKNLQNNKELSKLALSKNGMLLQ